MDTASHAELSIQYSSKSIGKSSECHSGRQVLSNYLKDILLLSRAKSGEQHPCFSAIALFQVFHILIASRLCECNFDMGALRIFSVKSQPSVYLEVSDMNNNNKIKRPIKRPQK